MSQANLCDKVNVGDIIYYGEESFQVYKTFKSEVKEIALTTDKNGHVYALNACDFRYRAKDFVEPNPGEKFNFDNFYNASSAGIFHGFIRTVHREIKTVPSMFTGGELNTNSFLRKNLISFVSGDPKVYEFYDKIAYANQVIMEFTVIVPAQIIIPKFVEGFNKLCLMSYVIEVNGEGKLTRDQITKKVAELEGKPWIRSSNSDYFKNVPEHNDGTLRKAAKGKYGCILYGLGSAGKMRAAAVLAKLGPKLGYI